MAQHSASTTTAPAPAERSSRRALVTWVVAGVVALLVVVTGLVFLLSGSGSRGPGGTAASDGTAVPLGDLPASSTYTKIDAAPLDQHPTETTEGLVVHPVRDTAVFDAPGGTAIARMETRQIGDTWLPVIARETDWVQVLLPSKPNGSTGWLRFADLQLAQSDALITVNLKAKELELRRGGQVVGTWEIGIGKPEAPTPTGRTFLLGAFADDQQRYSPVILPLGAHSPTLDTYGGGPGTAAIHTWPTDDVYGKATSDGCIRVPPDALDLLSELPLGTLVMINEE